MKPIITVNTKQFEKFLKMVKFTRQELLDIRGAGAAMVVNNQRELVPVDTGATKLSIKSHIIDATAIRVEDEIGPETDYAYYIEYGVESKPNYPMQPFIRPSIEGAKGSAVENAIKTAFTLTIAKKTKL